MERNPNEIVKELDVLDILSNRPCGMTLPEIGNEMGVNWRGLAATVSALISEGSIQKLGNRYYPAFVPHPHPNPPLEEEGAL